METKIYLVRHGITAANLENRFAGRTDEPLHGDGITQMRKLGDVLKESGIGRIFSGPQLRTRQSAAIISDRIAAPVEISNNFDDIMITHWDGLHKEEIKARFGLQYEHWRLHPEEFRLPACEDLYQVQERAVRRIEGLFAGYSRKSLLVVSHLIVVRCLVLHYSGLAMQDFRTIEIKNGAVCGLFRNADGETTVACDL